MLNIVLSRDRHFELGLLKQHVLRLFYEAANTTSGRPLPSFLGKERNMSLTVSNLRLPPQTNLRILIRESSRDFNKLELRPLSFIIGFDRVFCFFFFKKRFAAE